MRDILLTLILIPLVPACFFRPWIGVLAWLWVAYMVPHGLAWGFARSIPIAVLSGGATLLGFFLSNDRKRLPRTWGVFFLVVFVVHITLSTLFAHNSDLAWGKWDWVAKGMLMTFVAMALFQDRVRLRYLYLVTALSLSFYGLRGAYWVFRTGGGGGWVMGPDKSFFADNNTLGLALCMILPVVLYLSREEPRRWLKRVLQVAFGLNIVAILFTYSRGSFLGLVVILGILIWRSPWRWRFATAIVIATLVFAPLAPERLWQRIGSISKQESEETRDNSAKGRLEAWTTAWNIAADHPIFGAGFRALWNDDLWIQYFGDNFLTVRDAHSLYFEVLAEHGFVGLILFFAILFNTLLTLRRIRRRWRHHADYGYLSHYAEMTQLSIYAFLVVGAFLGVAYFDLYWNLVAASFMLFALSAEAATATAAALPARRTAPAVALVPTRRPGRPARLAPARPERSRLR